MLVIPGPAAGRNPESVWVRLKPIDSRHPWRSRYRLQRSRLQSCKRNRFGPFGLPWNKGMQRGMPHAAQGDGVKLGMTGLVMRSQPQA